MLIVSGQAKRETALYKHGLIGKLRQLGDQEVDIVGMVKGITKYAVTVDDPQSIRYHLERALHLATTGRPGPCWLDIPVDVQGTKINTDELKPYDPKEDSVSDNSTALSVICPTILEKLAAAKRPVIMAGTGIRAAGAVEVFQRVIKKLGIPVTTAWTHDLLPTSHELFCGRPGSIGDRGGNFTVQNSDVLLTIGSRLNIRQVSYNWNYFARHAYKIQVDVDAAELEKPLVMPDMPVCCDARLFLDELDRQLDTKGEKNSQHFDWLTWCKERYIRYPTYLPEKHISPTRCDKSVSLQSCPIRPTRRGRCHRLR
jgi:acetolactate synthase-1/2/3 large subunit